MSVFLVSFVWDQRMVIFQLSGFYYKRSQALYKNLSHYPHSSDGRCGVNNEEDWESTGNCWAPARGFTVDQRNLRVISI